MRNLELRIAYVGTHFFGWQIQPKRRTVQGELNKALRSVLRLKEIRTIASSRTDSGVHAHDQRVSLTIGKPIPVENLKRALNHKLPHDVRVLEARGREPNFSPRYDARAKHYVYFIYNLETFSPLISSYVWSYAPPLDAEIMNAGAAIWTGTRCFKAFQAHKDRRVGSESTVFASRVYRLGNLVIFEILARHYLYHMVRNMLASLVRLGDGTWSMNEFQQRSLSGERVRQWITAPARGLHLFEVFFGAGPFALSDKGMRMGHILNQLNTSVHEKMLFPLCEMADSNGGDPRPTSEPGLKEDPGSF